MKTIFLLALLSFSFGAFGQSESLNYTFDSDIFQGERTISVYVPDAYSKADSNTRFHVAYLFDAQFQPYFTMVSSIMSYYAETNEGIPLIVVGIHTGDRWNEFVPTCDDEVANQLQGADRLSTFLNTEVFPLIDSLYRTSNFRIGIGHSLGGTFVLNEIFNPFSLFQAGIAVSPNLTVCNEQIVEDAKQFYAEFRHLNRFVYASIGSVGEMELDFRSSLCHLDSLAGPVNEPNIVWKCAYLEGHNHMTTFVPGFDAGYLALSDKLTLLDARLLDMVRDTSLSIEQHLVRFYTELASFTASSNQLSVDRVMKHATKLAQYGEFHATLRLCDFARDLLKKENLSAGKEKEIAKMIDERSVVAQFNALAKEAKQLALEGNYEAAAQWYLHAFELDVIRATHFVRIDAVPVLAQANKIDEAFEQLDLLANKFALGGNERFINDPRCTPLHGDKRWDKLMDKLAKNAELYR